MKLEKKYFDNVLIFRLNKYKDKRGCFFETFNKNDNIFKKYIKKNFLYDAISVNKKNVFRGLHYQTKYKQSKLVHVIEGKIIDIVLDLRKNSKTFLSFKKIVLSEDNNRIIFIPEGYAHGFITLSKKAIVSYKISNKYNRKYEKTIFWNDKRLKLILPKKIQKKIIISKKDCEKKN
jgi:dTDP-4-dehydrorhamnose 3,5-epimerase